MEKLESDLENFVRLCHLHEKVAKLEQALAEKDMGSIALQERIAYYDRWLSNGVYYTNDEFLERVLKPRQQLMEKAVMFAERLAAMDKGSEVHWNDVEEFLNSPEVKAWKE